MHPPVAMLRPVGVLLSFMMTACASAATARGTTATAEGVVREGVLEMVGESRSYRLFVPAAARAGGAPLLVMLHGCTQSPADVAAGTRLNDAAEERGFMVLYPEQPTAYHPQRCWRWYDPTHQQRDAGEPLVVATLTRQVAEEYRADASRIYVAGISAGALMALTVALAYPELYAAVGSHSGAPFGMATDVPSALALMRGESSELSTASERAIELMGDHARFIPLVIIHGEGDLVVRAANATKLAAQWVELASRLDVTLDSLPVHRFETNGRAATRITRVREGRPAMRMLLIEELGHAWSGGAAEGTYTDPRGPDATREMLDFLLQQRLER